MKRSALEEMGAAIERALDECSVSDVLGVLTGAFVGLSIELVRRQGHDINEKITIDGGNERDVTIHPPKVKTLHGAALTESMRPDVNQSPTARTCTYPKCNCPFDAPADPNWCARGLPHKQQNGG